MKAFIYVGGSVFPEGITAHPKSDDICIAADSGAKNAKIPQGEDIRDRAASC